MNELNVNEKESTLETLYGVGVELFGLSYSLHKDGCKNGRSESEGLMTNKQMIEWHKNWVAQPNCVGCEVHKFASRLHSKLCWEQF